jgi:hypothetical protein
VALLSGSVHGREGLGSEVSQGAEPCAAGGSQGVGRVIGFVGHDDAICRRCRVGAPSAEQVAAEQGPGGFVEQKAGLPVVGQVRGVDPAEAVAADVEDLTIGQGPGVLDRRDPRPRPCSPSNRWSGWREVQLRATG